MAIQTTGIGPHSARLDIDAGESAARVLDAIEGVVTGGGWTLHDGAAGPASRVYTAPNQDGVTSKFAQVDLGTDGWLMLDAWEDWDASAHVGVNSAGGAGDTDPRGTPRFDVTGGGTIWVFVGPGWLGLLTDAGTLVRSDRPLAVLCERDRVAPEDQPGVDPDLPPYVRISTMRFDSRDGPAHPRLLDGRVGGSTTDPGMVSLDGLTAGERLDGYPTAPNLWSGGTFVTRVQVTAKNGDGSRSGNALYGTLRGLHAVQADQGTWFTTISIESDDYVMTAGGTQRDYWIIPGSDGRDTFYRWAIPA